MARLITFIFVLTSASSWAQNVEVRTRFLADTLKIGETFPFSVTAVHPRSTNILYPDSSYSFNPFEFNRREYFPTVTKDSISYDSAIYYLTSYEIDSIQVFRLPVYVLASGDCTIVFGAADSIVLKQLVHHMPDSVNAEQLPLKTNTAYLNVSWLLNQRLITYVVFGVTFAAILTWVVFGKRIKRYYLLKRLTRSHADFLHRFADAIHQLQAGYSTVKAETALVIWKRYMEVLEERPYTKFSSKEMLSLLDDKNLAPALKSIDRMVYGGIASNPEVFELLREVSRSHYNEKVRKVNNQ